MALLQLKVILIGFFSFLFTQTPVFGCSCDRSSTIGEEISRSAFIIKGIPIAADTIGVTMVFGKEDTFYIAKIRFKFLIERCYMGVKTSDTTSILTGLGGGDCGYPFIIGKSYLLFAYSKLEQVFDFNLLKTIKRKNPTTGLTLKSQTYYQTSICSWTYPFSNEMELTLLKELNKNSNELLDFHSVPVVVKINDIVLYDTAISYPWLRTNYLKIKDEKYYDQRKAKRKFHINSKWGVLSIILYKGVNYP